MSDILNWTPGLWSPARDMGLEGCVTVLVLCCRDSIWEWRLECVLGTPLWIICFLRLAELGIPWAGLTINLLLTGPTLPFGASPPVVAVAGIMTVCGVAWNPSSPFFRPAMALGSLHSATPPPIDSCSNGDPSCEALLCDKDPTTGNTKSRSDSDHTGVSVFDLFSFSSSRFWRLPWFFVTVGMDKPTSGAVFGLDTVKQLLKVGIWW